MLSSLFRFICLYSKTRNAKMPLFSNKFSPKKPPPRKTAVNFNSDVPLENLISESGVVKLQLGQQKFNFENGDWKPRKLQPS